MHQHLHLSALTLEVKPVPSDLPPDESYMGVQSEDELHDIQHRWADGDEWAWCDPLVVLRLGPYLASMHHDETGSFESEEQFREEVLDGYLINPLLEDLLRDIYNSEAHMAGDVSLAPDADALRAFLASHNTTPSSELLEELTSFPEIRADRESRRWCLEGMDVESAVRVAKEVVADGPYGPGIEGLREVLSDNPSIGGLLLEGLGDEAIQQLSQEDIQPALGATNAQARRNAIVALGRIKRITREVERGQPRPERAPMR